MSQPRISQGNSWERYKQELFLLIHETLLVLQLQTNLPEIEDNAKYHSLNRELFRCFRVSYRKLNLSFHMPTREGKNPPYFGDIAPTEREEKRPDFYWQFIDSLASEDSCERRFILECKRLGSPSSSNWKLNPNYVNHGVLRFLSSPHEYGKGDDAGGMIGYVQDMEFDDILQEVNQTAATHPKPIPLLQIVKNWEEKETSELVHDLQRPFPISPFRLHRFWVDLREYPGD
ncbi:MAG: hypothetical protein GY796_36415 [Chloroflexi bacterium]|nr:hypothetical protein [Chloroflexota bacterium]